MKNYNTSGTMTKGEIFGRIPTPKKGGHMGSKKGKGSYNRKSKHRVAY